MTCRRSALCLVALLGAGCAEAPVYRAVSLALQEPVPGADSVLLADRLRLVVRDLEPLTEGALFAWARAGSSWAALGPLAAGGATAFTVADPAGLEELLVTHESAVSPTSPSGRVIFRGRPGEALALGGYGGPSRSALALAEVSAELENQRLVLHATGLPYVGSGLHYAVWMRSEEAHGEPARDLQVGTVGASGRDEFVAEELLAAFTEVVVTLELDAGDEAPGTELMMGHTLSEAATVGQKAVSHEH